MVNRKLLILLAIALVIFFTVMHIRYGAFAQAQSAVAARSAGTARSADAGVSSRESDFSEENEVNVNDNVTRDVTEFKVNAPINFNYKTKAEIYGIRKKFVAESLFKNPDYTPSKTVFSKIADGKQWITLEYEYYDKNSSEGYSEESRFINNPTALIMLDIPFSSVNAGKYWGEDMYLLPKSISYHKEENTIKTAYSLQKFFSELHPGLKNEFLCFLNGLNARDFGYPWVFVYQSDNVTFRP
ncbi:MAG: hypothetical protein FWC57_05190, partial [Endomicrobia bacterium]|nr:hypothetical protein [Endomicrobiia bacterium]